MADIKISELEPTTDLEGLFTIGSDKNNLSKKVSLQFLKDAANYANEQGDYAKQAGDTVNGNVGVSDYPEFSASKSYVIGDIVRYNGVLYAFTANHAASAWNGNDVKATSINAITSGKLTELESDIDLSFNLKGQVNSASDFADNAESGVMSFTSNQVPIGLPNIDYSLGGTLITTRADKSALKTYDRQVLVTPTIIATRVYVTDAWQDWVYEDLRFNSKGLVYSTSDFANNAQNGVISFTSTEVPMGLPKLDYGGGGTLITARAKIIGFTNFDRQVLITPNAIATRPWANGAWTGWTITIISAFVQKKSVNSSSDFADNAQSGIISFTSYQVPIGLPDIDYSLGGTLITTRSNNLTLSTYDRQVLITPTIIATRAYVTDAWQGWSVSYIGQEVITCGEGKQYSRLRDAVAEGVKYGCKVVVYAGIYDLAQEFAEELANESGSGIELKNNVHVLFLPGSYVRCELPFSSWSYHQFEPFHAEGSFTLENLHIVSKNTRYSVHDDLWGTKEYKNTYINCHMEHTDEKENPNYVQCIGGGMGKNGYIEIVGGYYKSNPVNMPNGNEMQQCISYHNGPSAECDGKIVIRDVYLADKGYLRFGYYGPSTKITPVSVSGCRMYRDVLLAEEAGNNDHIVNFEIISYNNEIVA